MKTLPVDYLHECLLYDYEKGTLTWQRRPREHFATEAGFNGFTSKFAGKITGHKRPDGYLDIFLGKRLYLAHRIAFAMFYGYWPESIDHINGHKSDNRSANLRDCSHEENMRNQGGKKTKTTPLKGAYFNKRMKKWQSSICVKYKSHHLGTFETAEEAHSAYVAASMKMHGTFSNAG